MIHGLAGPISFISSCQKESFSVRNDYFETKEKFSFYNKLGPATINHFLPQNIIFHPKKLFLVTRNYSFLLEIDE